jgi:hypothetical protein
MWLDLLFSRARLPDRHALYVGAAATVYAFANLGFTLNNYPLYSVLTWRSGASAGLAIGAIVASMAFFYLGSAVSSCLERCQRLPPARKAEAVAYSNTHWPLEFYDDADALCCSTACCCCRRSTSSAAPTASAADGLELPGSVVVVGGHKVEAIGQPTPAGYGGAGATPARGAVVSHGHPLAPGGTTFVGTPIDTADFGGPVHVGHAAAAPAGGGGRGSPRGGRWPAGGAPVGGPADAGEDEMEMV